MQAPDRGARVHHETVEGSLSERCEFLVGRKQGHEQRRNVSHADWCNARNIDNLFPHLVTVTPVVLKQSYHLHTPEGCGDSRNLDCCILGTCLRCTEPHRPNRKSDFGGYVHWILTDSVCLIDGSIGMDMHAWRTTG